MVTFTVGLRGQTEKPHGLGPKIVEGEITGASGDIGVSIDAKDIELRTIYHLQVVGYNAGTHFIVKLGTFTPGDIAAANYASVAASGIGTSLEAPLGTFRIFAIGE